MSVERTNLADMQDELADRNGAPPPADPTPSGPGLGSLLASGVAGLAPSVAAYGGGLGQGLGLTIDNPDVQQAMAAHGTANSLGQGSGHLALGLGRLAGAAQPSVDTAMSLANPMMGAGMVVGDRLGQALAGHFAPSAATAPASPFTAADFAGAQTVRPYTPPSEPAAPAAPARPAPKARGAAPVAAAPALSNPLADPRLEQSAVERTQKIQGALDEKARLSGEAARKASDANEKDQTAVDQALERHRAMIEDIYKSGIDPGRMWRNMGTEQKVWANIGRVFTAMGNGLTGQNELSAIDKSIQQDVAAQEKSLEQKKTGAELQGNLVRELMDRGVKRQDAAALTVKLMGESIADKIEAFRNPNAIEVAAQVRANAGAAAREILKGQADLEKTKSETAKNYAEASKSRAEAAQMGGSNGVLAPTQVMGPSGARYNLGDKELAKELDTSRRLGKGGLEALHVLADATNGFASPIDPAKRGAADAARAKLATVWNGLEGVPSVMGEAQRKEVDDLLHNGIFTPGERLASTFKTLERGIRSNVGNTWSGRGIREDPLADVAPIPTLAQQQALAGRR